jgi:hypothetical protein
MSAEADQYRAKAADCEKRANEARSSLTPELFREQARRWRELAEQAEG